MSSQRFYTGDEQGLVKGTVSSHLSIIQPDSASILTNCQHNRTLVSHLFSFLLFLSNNIVVTITEPVVVKPKRVRRNQPTPEAPSKPVPTVETWGIPDREKAIQLLCWDSERKHLAVARKNGLVQLLDPKDGTITTEFKHTLGKEGKVDTVFVGLFASSEYVFNCSFMYHMSLF